MHNATYSPEDNKLRLYPECRLSKETYDRVKAAGFKWAPKQELFVASWTPEREDLLIELCGEIGDEDTSLVDRAEERAERFEEYSDKRGAEAHRAKAAVDAIADNIPLGQPILVGHHSERRARRDAEQIENGMRKAVNAWRTSQYWLDRAQGALAHAKYKELPAVRARRIKTIEADKRKQERHKAEAERWLRLWSKEGLTLDQAKAIANGCWLHLSPKQGDREGWPHSPTAYDALNDSHPSLYAPRTLEEIIEHAKRIYPDAIATAERWIAHYDNRLAYERAMLGEAGGIATDKVGPEKGGACRCWASPGYGKGWSYIKKVNKVSVTVEDNWGNGGRNFTRTIPFDKLTAVMTAAQVEAARAEGRLAETDNGSGFYLRDEAPKARPEPEQPKPEAQAFEAMRETLKAGVQIVSAPQLFPTPPELAARLVELAEIQPGQEVLEPSAGTGNLLRAIRQAQPDAPIHAVEINHRLMGAYAGCPPLADSVTVGDFLAMNGELGQFDRIVMNPPFERGEDIKHILHAMAKLKDGGRLVAICANGPRQQATLQPLATAWLDLPPGSFKDQGTNVNTAIVVIEK